MPAPYLRATKTSSYLYRDLRSVEIRSVFSPNQDEDPNDGLYGGLPRVICCTYGGSHIRSIGHIHEPYGGYWCHLGGRFGNRTRTYEVVVRISTAARDFLE